MARLAEQGIAGHDNREDQAVSEARGRKLADRIQVIVAETLRTRVKDPRIGFITITDVRVSKDLRDASVYYTVFGPDADRALTARALESARGLLRSEIGRQTGLRFTPTLALIADALPEDAAAVTELLARARAADDALHQQATQAHYAGDPDPYKKRRAVDEDDADLAAGSELGDVSEAGDADADAGVGDGSEAVDDGRSELDGRGGLRIVDAPARP